MLSSCSRINTVKKADHPHALTFEQVLTDLYKQIMILVRRNNKMKNLKYI